MALKSLGTTTAMVFVTLVVMTIEMAFAYPKSNKYWSERKHLMRNCRDIQRLGTSISGVYTIYPFNSAPNRPVKVFCDLETNGGGWTVIQRRDDIVPREDFNRTWMEYALGFGDLRGEFWLGNDIIHALTSQALNEIRFYLADFENNNRWARYKFFYVHGMDNSYKLEVNGYSGNAGDSFLLHNGMLFSAIDKDIDMHDVHSCSEMCQGGWWYMSCHISNLNGFYHGGKHNSFGDGINWFTWKGYYYSLKTTEMKMRPYY